MHIRTLMGTISRSIYSNTECWLLEIPDLKCYQKQFKRSPHHDLSGVTVKVAEQEDFEQLSHTIEKFNHTRKLADRRQRGDVCIVAYKDEALACFTWAALEEYELVPGKRMYLNSDEAFSYDSYTLPQFRRRGIHSESYRYKADYLQKIGINTIYSDIDRNNEMIVPLIKKTIKRGAEKKLGTLRIINFCGLKHYHFQGETTKDAQKIARLFNIPPSKVSSLPPISTTK